MRRSLLVGFKFLPNEKKKKFVLEVNEDNAEVFEHFISEVGKKYIKPRINGDDLPVFSLVYIENGQDVELNDGDDLHNMLIEEPPLKNIDIDIANYKGINVYNYSRAP